MALSREDVQEILRLLDDLHATELQLRTRHYTLSLRRVERAGEVGGAWAESTTVEPAAEEPVPPPDDDAALHAVRTPLTGTFYRAPKPGAPPFVEIGATVVPDTVVGIVESMKLMNSVHAGVSGTVAEICLDNAELVEEGSVLMRVAQGAEPYRVDHGSGNRPSSWSTRREPGRGAEPHAGGETQE